MSTVSKIYLKVCPECKRKTWKNELYCHCKRPATKFQIVKGKVKTFVK